MAQASSIRRIKSKNEGREAKHKKSLPFKKKKKKKKWFLDPIGKRKLAHLV
jgi:hypothetical protein